MSEEFKNKCRSSACRRGFNGNQYVDRNKNKR